MNYEGFEVYFSIINPKITRKGKRKYILCETLINNEFGINEIRIYEQEIVAFSVDGKEIQCGQKAIIPLEDGKVKFMIKV